MGVAVTAFGASLGSSCVSLTSRQGEISTREMALALASLPRGMTGWASGLGQRWHIMVGAEHPVPAGSEQSQARHCLFSPSLSEHQSVGPLVVCEGGGRSSARWTPTEK